MIINTSKALYCDFLLVKLWQSYLISLGFNPKQDLLDYSGIVSNFPDYLEKTLGISSRYILEQFGINSNKDLQVVLKNSYKILRDKEVVF